MPASVHPDQQNKPQLFGPTQKIQEKIWSTPHVPINLGVCGPRQVLEKWHLSLKSPRIWEFTCPSKMNFVLDMS